MTEAFDALERRDPGEREAALLRALPVQIAAAQATTAFAEILRDSLRSSDLAGRVGGEEFAVLLPHTDLAGALLLAERIRHAVASYCRVPQHPELRMTVSIGASELLPEDPSPEVALARTDAALYRA